ncbi:MAG TPA: hypothetical protein VKX17_09475 [Planctomycetota bacterium]|nr:hypothetical protein [Planctomycetota bacterium]
MKPRVILSLFPVLLVLFVIGGAQKAGAVEIGVSVGGGYHHGYRDYRTVDPVYDSWYSSDATSYGYTDNIYVEPTYVDPYVYVSPSVGFDTWYGDGYRGHGGSYSGGHSGYGGGRSSGGGHSSGGGGHGGGRR